MTKLTERQVESARRMRAGGMTYVAIGARFNVNEYNVRIALDPEYHQMRKDRAREARRIERAKAGPKREKPQTRHLTPAQIDEARQLFADGWTYPRLGERFGFTPETIKRALDEQFQARRCAQVREARRLRSGFGGQKPPPLAREPATAISIKADGLARLAEIPPDTRSLTARVFGDPLPGRSALDMRFSHG